MNMDTAQLKVGQKLWMQSANEFKEATVVEITKNYIGVKPVSFGESERPWMIRFQKDGKQFSLESVFARSKRTNVSEYSMGELGVYEWYESGPFAGWWRDDPFPRCGEGLIPWELVV